MLPPLRRLVHRQEEHHLPAEIRKGLQLHRHRLPAGTGQDIVPQVAHPAAAFPPLVVEGQVVPAAQLPLPVQHQGQQVAVQRLPGGDIPPKPQAQRPGGAAYPYYLRRRALHPRERRGGGRRRLLGREVNFPGKEGVVIVGGLCAAPKLLRGWKGDVRQALHGFFRLGGDVFPPALHQVDIHELVVGDAELVGPPAVVPQDSLHPPAVEAPAFPPLQLPDNAVCHHRAVIVDGAPVGLVGAVLEDAEGEGDTGVLPPQLHLVSLPGAVEVDPEGLLRHLVAEGHGHHIGPVPVVEPHMDNGNHLQHGGNHSPVVDLAFKLPHGDAANHAGSSPSPWLPRMVPPQPTIFPW